MSAGYQWAKHVREQKEKKKQLYFLLKSRDEIAISIRQVLSKIFDVMKKFLFKELIKVCSSENKINVCFWGTATFETKMF